MSVPFIFILLKTKICLVGLFLYQDPLFTFLKTKMCLVELILYLNPLFYPSYDKNKNTASCIEQVLEPAPYKAAAVWPPTTHQEKLDEPDMWNTAGEVGMNS